MLRTVVIAFICGWAGQALAVEDCSKLADKTLRLDCYDRMSKSQDAATPTDQDASSNDHLFGDFDLTDPADVWVAPNKYKGRGIELREVQCFYADVGDYRCIAPNDGSPLLVVTRSVVPQSAKNKLEKDCGMVKTLDSPKCTRTIHVTPILAQDDNPTALVHRVIIGAESIEMWSPAR